METKNAFLERVLGRLPKGPVRDFTFTHWDSGRPTSEALGILPVPGADPQKLLSRVMDVDHYLGNIGRVVESRAIADPAYVLPVKVRFYQRVKIPLVGEIQMDLVLERMGTLQGYEVAAWSLNEGHTAALDPKKGIRSAYNDGAWIVAPGIVGYALSSAPRREDVGFLKWQALTKGADVAAATAIKENIQAMSAWASRS
jgi:hypothetical protein